MRKITKNKDQQVYVLPAGDGFSCYGFNNCIKMRNALAAEYNKPQFTKGAFGTMKTYREYERLVDIARQAYQKDGRRSKSGLNAKLIGLEGKRVEVVYTDGSKDRFYVGKSSGWVPCHLEIKQSNSSGGGSVRDAESMKSVKVLY